MTDYTGDDIYCDLILPGLLPVERVLETETVLAFHHTRPFWPVHIVVIPKRHIASLLEVDSQSSDMGDLMLAIQIVSQQVLEEHGAVAAQTHLGRYQDSRHLHWHVHSGPPLNGAGNEP